MSEIPPISQLKGRPLGRVLIKMGKLTRDKVQQALALQKESKTAVPLGQVLINLGFITEKDLNLAQAFQLGMPYINISGIDIPDTVISQITAQIAMTYKILPVDFDPQTKKLTIAIASADNFRATDDLRTLLGYNVEAMITDADSLEKGLARYYSGQTESINELIGELTDDEYLAEFAGRGESIDLSELRNLADSNPVKKLLNLVLLQAIRDRPRTFILSLLRRNSRCGTGWTACCMKWYRRRTISRWPSAPVSRLWPTWISPSGVCRRTAVFRWWCRTIRWICVFRCCPPFLGKAWCCVFWTGRRFSSISTGWGCAAMNRKPSGSSSTGPTAL